MSVQTERLDAGPQESSTSSSGADLLSVMAVPLGIAGLGGVWQALGSTLSAPAWPTETLFAVSAGLWFLLSLTYVVRGLRQVGRFAEDRRHPLYGPFAAYIPVIGILIASHYVQFIHDTARVFVIVFVFALAILLAQLLAHWLLGNLSSADLHPGYLLPTVAGPFIASIGLGSSGWEQAAEGAFGIGIFLWIIVGAFIFSRLFAGEPLPDRLKPLLSVLVTAPATSGIAWFIIARGQLNTVEYSLIGVLFLMLLVQVPFFSEYRALAFTLTFWAFIFPISASTNLIIRWIASEAFPGWRIWSWTLAAIATAAVLVIAIASVIDRVKHRPRIQGATPMANRHANHLAQIDPGPNAHPAG